MTCNWHDWVRGHGLSIERDLGESPHPFWPVAKPCCPLPGNRAFTPVFDGLCGARVQRRAPRLRRQPPAAQLKDDPEGYLAKDFAALLETMAIGAGVKLKSENQQVPTGLD